MCPDADRRGSEPFTPRQVELVTTFSADQAVIALENARLVSTNCEKRTGDLQKSLDYQTAISEVLRVISGSAFDLEPVLQSVVSTAIRLCRADQAVIYRNVEGEYRWAAGNSLAPEYEEIERDVRDPTRTKSAQSSVAPRSRRNPYMDSRLPDRPQLRGPKMMPRSVAFTPCLACLLLRDRLAIGVITAWRVSVSKHSPKRRSRWSPPSPRTRR